MRRALVLAAVLLVAAGCGVVEEREVDVVLRVGSVRSGELGVKASDGEIGAAVAAVVPSGSAGLTLQSTDVSSRRYYVSSGQEVRVAVGRYRVSGSYEKEQKVGTLGQNAVVDEPIYVVPDQEIVVEEGVGEYVVDAQWACWALVLDRDLVAGYKQREDRMGTWRSIEFGGGELEVLFVGSSVSWNEISTLYLRSEPADEENYEAKEYRLVNRDNNQGSGATRVRDGYWYVLGPTGVTFQSGTIGVTYPEWRKGE